MANTTIRIEPTHHSFPHFIMRAIIGVFLAVVFALLFGIFVQMLWNWLMPSIFNLGTITYLQAFGLMILARLIFGGIKHHATYSNSRHRHWGERCRPRHWEWHNRGYKGSNEVRDWEHYDEWWESEGKEAFKKYAENRGNAESEE